jgi:23S rRNA pseudouridine1911/1915/1917 synthase
MFIGFISDFKKILSLRSSLGHTTPMATTWTAQAPERLDIFLAREGGMHSRGQAQKSIEEGLVTVNGEETLKISLRLRTGDTVKLLGELSREDEDAIKPTDLKLAILHEDDACFVIDKPAGIAVHPGSGMLPGEKTVLHGAAFLFKKRKLPFSADAVLVHRLDKETTGCLLIAKTREAHMLLQKQFETRTVQKFYLAITAGIPSPDRAVIDAPIGRSAVNRTKMGITRMSSPRDARTSYAILSKGLHAALLLCELHTGRTHQIRVHLHAIEHPILGDDKYQNHLSERFTKEYGIECLCLHAWKLTFRSPADGKEHTAEAKIPKMFAGVMKKMELKLRNEKLAS